MRPKEAPRGRIVILRGAYNLEAFGRASETS
jgi:hypothetical protein